MKRCILSYTTLLALTIGLFAACEKEINFSGEEKAPLLVLNSIAQVDSPLTIALSRSLFFLTDDKPYDLKEKAELSLYVNDQLHSQQTLSGATAWHTDYRPKPYDKIRITATAPTYPAIAAEAVMPEPPIITRIDTLRSQEDQRPQQIKITFKDPGGERNFYQVTARKTLLFDIYSHPLKLEVPYSLADNNKESFNGLLDFDVSHKKSTILHLFDNSTFDGKEYTLTLNLQKPHLAESSTITLSLNRVSEALYLFLKTAHLQQSTEILGFAEPVKVYNNVEHGIGILGTIATSQVQFLYEQPKEEPTSPPDTAKGGS